MNCQVGEPYLLKLYVAGQSPRSCLAIANFRALCEEYLKGRHRAEVIDVLKEPRQARDAQIVATPTLVKESPGPPRKMVGTLSDTDRVLAALDLGREEKSR